MNVSLTPELERFINLTVERGYYNSASEVVREALRMLKEVEDARHIRHVGRLRNLMKNFRK
jgi:antitoxin ParD1/3/4